MKLKELRRIAEARGHDDGDFNVEYTMDVNEATFFETCLTHIDALLKVAETANSFINHYCDTFQIAEAHRGQRIENFKRALKELEEIK